MSLPLASPSFLENLDRLEKLELWRELAIRPSQEDCHDEDRILLVHQVDDIHELERRSLRVRELMNNHLPLFQTPLEEHLVASPSQIPQAGYGLFYQPDGMPNNNQAIPVGVTLCYYYGHIHNVQSARKLSDKSYVMLVSGNLLVDPRSCLHIKARYINDPLNDALLNCMYVPETALFRCAVVSIKEIQPNSELFASYGDLYWSQQNIMGNFFKGT
jgi:hypothetical protein